MNLLQRIAKNKKVYNETLSWALTPLAFFTSSNLRRYGIRLFMKLQQ